VTRDFHGQPVRLRVPLVVREVSLDGFSIESPVPFPTGIEETFNLGTGGGTEIPVTARCVHTTCVASAPPRYVSGFLAVAQSVQALRQVVEALAPGTTEDSAGGSGVPASPGASRRRLPRFDVTGSITIVVGDGRIPADLHNIGLGGFAAESSTQFSLRQRYRVRFTGPDGLDVHLIAEALHARQGVGADGATRWFTGFAYVIDSPDAHEAVETVLEHATACLSFL